MLDKIKESLKDRNVAAIAKRIGLSAETIYRIKRGDPKANPTHRTIKKLAKYLEITGE